MRGTTTWGNVVSTRAIGSENPAEKRARNSAIRAWIAAIAVLALPSAASAQRQDDERQLDLMNEPTTYTDVVDSFDGRDPFDLNLTVGYERRWEFGTLQRERTTSAGRDWADVADYSRGINQLNFGLDIGILPDLALYARLPLILSDDRTLSMVGGADTTAHADGSLLFPNSGDVNSPTRSGVDWMSVGLAWSILNQHRDHHVPTWLLMLEGRFNIGDSMRACIETSGGLQCQGGVNAPGVGRGVNALRVETRGSYRYEYIEPYWGLSAQIEWPGNGDDFYLPFSNIEGYINQRPPIRGMFTAGTAIIPWEDREHWQRFTIDLRFQGEYVSEGHDYSPIFDALGSSQNPALSRPVCENGAVEGDGNPCPEGLNYVPFYGLTDTQSHVRVGGQINFEMRVARYVRFNLGVNLMHAPAYNLTMADACNPNFDASDGDPRRGIAGQECRNNTIVNPHHRDAIDLPGQRFRMDSQTNVDLNVSATAMF